MPSVVRAVDGAVVGTSAAAHVRVYEWVDVLPADRRLDPGELGRLLASIHAAGVPTASPSTGGTSTRSAPRPGRNCCCAYDGPLSLSRRLAALLPPVLEAEGILTSPRRVQLCHRDLWADHVRRTREGGPVVLDWENSGPGDVNGELGCALFEYGLCERDRMRTLYAAYVDAGGPGRLAGRGDLTMLVAQLGNIARVGCERWLTSSTDQERAGNVDGVAEFVDEPVTVRDGRPDPPRRRRPSVRARRSPRARRARRSVRA